MRVRVNLTLLIPTGILDRHILRRVAPSFQLLVNYRNFFGNLRRMGTTGLLGTGTHADVNSQVV